MKLLLISPRGSFLSRNKEFNEFWNSSRALQTYRKYWSGIGSNLALIAALTPPEVDVEIIDENMEEIDYNKKYDLVGITAMTQQALRAYEIAGKFRKRMVPVVIGGIHATCEPDEAKVYADAVVIGEVESVWKELIDDAAHGKLKPKYKAKELVDINKSPTPRYNLVEKYPYRNIWVQATRGCAHRCEFCVASNVFGTKSRRRNISLISKDIQVVKKLWPAALIGFADDNIAMNKAYLSELIGEIAPLNIRYLAQADISIGEDLNLLKKIKESGCKFLFIGFESLDEKNISGISKNGIKAKKFKYYGKLIDQIQQTGIGVMGGFIIGFDHDTAESIMRIADFVKGHHMYGAQISILTPLPGTRIREMFASENRLMDTNWNNYTFFDVNHIPMHMTKEQIDGALLKLYKSIYDEENLAATAKHFKAIFDKVNENN